MKALIFAAGKGTRLKPFTDQHPKALALVNGVPLLERNIKYLQSFGINDFVINIHHFGDQIVDFLKAKDNFGARIEISDESEELLETGGGLVFAENFGINAVYSTERKCFKTFIEFCQPLFSCLNIHPATKNHFFIKKQFSGTDTIRNG